MNKRGLIGYILLSILGALIILGAIIGITVYQVVSFVGFVQEEVPLLESDIAALTKGDCSKTSAIELRFDNIKSESDSVCKNPLIRWGVSKADSLPFNCDNIETIYAGLLEDFDHVEEVCSQKS
jgi:hypothetical protein